MLEGAAMPTMDRRAEITFDKILVATDFSPVAEVATAYAIGLARRFSSSLELTNIVDLARTVPSIEVPIGPAIDAAKQRGEECMQRVADGISGVKVSKTVVEGFLPASIVLEEACKSSSDLIVMGTSSKHGLEKLFLGSTAEEVIRKADCPVLTVGPHVMGPEEIPLAFQRIVYATDLSSQAAKAANYALSFAEDSGAHIYLCRVVDESDALTATTIEESLSSLRDLVPHTAYDWCTPEFVIEYGSVANVILGLARRVNADLIVLGARRSSFWLTYIDTGLTPALLAEAECPVLTIC
jgi:nucleotide-binding universal stress UspA family protein